MTSFNSLSPAWEKLDQPARQDKGNQEAIPLSSRDARVDKTVQSRLAPLTEENLSKHDQNNAYARKDGTRSEPLAEEPNKRHWNHLSGPRSEGGNVEGSDDVNPNPELGLLPRKSLWERAKVLKDSIFKSASRLARNTRSASELARGALVDLKVYLTPSDITVLRAQKQWSQLVNNMTLFFSIPSVRKATIATAVIGLIILTIFQPVATGVIIAVIVAGVGAKYLYGKKEQIIKAGEQLGNSAMKGGRNVINTGQRLARGAMKRAGEALDDAKFRAEVQMYNASDFFDRLGEGFNKLSKSLEGAKEEIENVATSLKGWYWDRKFDSLLKELNEIENQINEEYESNSDKKNELLEELKKRESKIYQEFITSKITHEKTGETIRVSELYQGYYKSVKNDESKKIEELEAQFPFLREFNTSFYRLETMKELSDLEEARMKKLSDLKEARSIANQIERIEKRKAALLKRAEKHGYNYSTIDLLQLGEKLDINGYMDDLEQRDLKEAYSILGERERLNEEQNALIDRLEEEQNALTDRTIKAEHQAHLDKILDVLGVALEEESDYESEMSASESASEIDGREWEEGASEDEI